jgi:hypothetical protein
MADITAVDTFDDELLDEELAEELSSLLEWLNSNTQNLVNALQGNIGDTNLAMTPIVVKCSSGIRKTVNIQGPVSHVELSRIDSQIDSNSVISGFNWWPTTNGFAFVAQFGDERKDRNAYLRVHFDV